MLSCFHPVYTAAQRCMCKAPSLDLRLYKVDHGVALRRLQGVPSSVRAAGRITMLDPILPCRFSDLSPRKAKLLKNSPFR